MHLRVRSAYSLLEGALKIPNLVNLVLHHQMPAVALTDTNNLFGALEFSQTFHDAGIQPIVGCSLAVSFADQGSSGTNGAGLNGAHQGGDGYTIALLAKDAVGYQNLMRLSSAAYLEHDDVDAPHVGLQKLARHHEGLIALTGGPEGPIDRAIAAGDRDKASKRLGQLSELFGDRLYVELQRHGLPEEQMVEPHLLDLAEKNALPNCCHQ